ncbi:MAG: HD-GYP domain-containing protein [Alkaliphilus sp.]|nr:HD-GYP domain-containing protein [Alkaliphilus sp.]
MPIIPTDFTIDDQNSSNEIEDILKPEIRKTAIESIREAFAFFEKYSGNAVNNNEPLTEDQIAKERKKYLQSINNIAKEIVEEVLYHNNVTLNLVDIKNPDNYTYNHVVNVAVLSLVIGIELRMDKNELHELCIGAMLHDLGMTFIPKSILLKSSKLDEGEFEIIKTHTTKGYEYISGQYELPVSAKLIALQHHERLDGSGYPSGYEADDIHKLAKIVAIADVYDALTSDTPYRRAVAPHEAIELVMGSAGRLFDFEMAKIFVRKIVPYPVGSLVKLSSGDVGVVQEIRLNYPLRPKVKIVRQSAVSIIIKEVDLMVETNIVVEGLQFETPNASVPHYLQKRIDE